VSAAYVPARGDVIWMNFDPQAGHAQAGHRPALVLSPRDYNALRGMAIVCPMTSKRKKYVFEVVVSEEPPSVVLADQIKSIDWRSRGAERKGRVAPHVVEAVLAKVHLLLEP